MQADSITQTFSKRWVFFTGFLLVVLIAGLFLLQQGKVGSFFWLNAYHRPWLDRFFQYYTNIGDGLFAVVLALMLFFVWQQRKCGLLILVSFALTGLFAQLIKRMVQAPRPMAFFQPDTLPFFIKEIIHGGNNSFPSGHTATAFAMATLLALYTSKRWQQLSLLMLAWLVGFSRVYLSQHFLTDVLGGALLGCIGSLVCVYLFRGISDEQLRFKKTSQ